MSVQQVTFAEMMKSEMITGIVNRINPPLSLFQRFLGRAVNNPATATQVVPGRQCGWDIYDSTRQIATASSPNTPPKRINRKPIGHQSATLMRTHESIMILDEEVYNVRQLGGQYGSQALDMRGQMHVRRQVDFMFNRMANQYEWMTSRMFQGGFNMVPDNAGGYLLKDYNSAATDEIVVNYQIPSENLGGLDLGTGSDILSDWSSASADIPGQLLEINKAFTRLHGLPLSHVWLNSTTYNYLLNNTKLSTQGGSSMTIFRSLTQRPMEGEKPDAGFDVVFRAFPQVTFHVYDGVLSATSADTGGQVDGTTTTATDNLIPDNYAIFLPEPNDQWQGMIQGSEVIRENVVDNGRVIEGFGTWATPQIDPAGFEMKMVNNYLPVLYVPTAVAFGDVTT
jgi:hypothetical protein